GSGVGSVASSPAITLARYSRTSRSTILPPAPLPRRARQSTLFSSASLCASGVMPCSVTGVLLGFASHGAAGRNVPVLRDPEACAATISTRLASCWWAVGSWSPGLEEYVVDVHLN